MRSPRAADERPAGRRGARAMRALYRVHAWLGLLCGLIVLALCLSGSLAVFRAEVMAWSGGALPPAGGDCRLMPDEALEKLRTSFDIAPIRRLSLPELTGGYYELRLADGRRAALDYCGSAVATARAEVGAYLVNLHTRLFMGKQGRWIVGTLGIAMLISALSGLILHRKLFTQLFTWRRDRSTRLWLSDAHKLVGIWLLPFHLLIAFSGAWLGLYTLLGGNQWDRQASAPKTSSYLTPATLEAMLERSRQALPGFEPMYIDFFPERGHVSVRGNLPGHLVPRHRAEALFSGHDGQLLALRDPRAETGLQRLHGLMMPLHLGDWSGAALRWLYCLMGLGSAWLTWLGLRLWANRRERSAGLLLRSGPAAGRALRAALGGLLVGNGAPLFGAAWWPGAIPLDGSGFLLALVGGATLVIAVETLTAHRRTGLPEVPPERG